MHLAHRKAPNFVAALALVLAALQLLAVPSSQAAPGDLDPAFGKGGKVTTSLGSNQSLAYGVALQPDGKAVAVGETRREARLDFAAARYRTNGALDPTFGAGGKVVTTFGLENAVATAVATSRDERIVAAGAKTTSGSTHVQFALVRYKRDGKLDPTFGSDGMVESPFGLDNIGFFPVAGLALQADGKIILMGTTSPPNSSEYRFALARYNRDGSLDTSFGGGGAVSTSFGTDGALAEAIALQPDGRIVVAGARFSVGGEGIVPEGFALARYKVDGSLDPTFGTGGLVTTPVASGGAAAAAVALQKDGKIVAAGRAYMAPGLTDPEIALTRYEQDGSLDSTFGNGGTVTTRLGDDPSIRALAIRANGRIIAAGRFLENHSVFRFALVRYKAEGSLDRSFGKGGIVGTSFGPGDAEANAVTAQSDGRILAGGDSFDPTAHTTRFALARYLDNQPVCLVPKLTHQTLSQARRAIVRAHCSLGTIRRLFSKRVDRGRVIAQRPAPGSRLPARAKVKLVLSKGRRSDH